MKQLLLFCMLLLTTWSVRSQISLNNHTTPLDGPFPSLPTVASGPQTRITTCDNDTVLYPLAKAIGASLYDLVGNGGGSYGEGVAQWYPAPNPITIYGFVFHGRAAHDDVVVNARLYTSTADSLPLLQLASVPVTLDSTGPILSQMTRYAMFATPITVTTPYLVAVEGQLLSTDTFNLVLSSDGSGGEEYLSQIRALGTVWLGAEEAYAVDADFLAYPITSYDLNASFAASSACAGEDVEFTNLSSDILGSRFYNQAAFFDMLETSYSWDFGDGSEIENTENPEHEYPNGGDYVVNLTDTLFGWTMNCSTDTSVLVSVTDLVLTADVTPITCHGEDNGEIDLSVDEGTPAYTYNWSNGAVTQDVSNLEPDSYTVIVTDLNGCTDTMTTTITEPDELLVSGTVTQQTTGNDASIDIDVEGGTEAYTYAWSNGETTEDIDGLSDGTYTVVVTDDNGCMDSATFIVDDLGLEDFAAGWLQLYPNPTTGIVNISITNYPGEAIALEVHDVTGKIVRQSVITGEAGTLETTCDLTYLAPGNYTITLGNEQVSHTQQFVLLK